MFLFYVDESGTYLNDNQTNFFVLAAIAIADENSSQLEREIRSFKQEIFKKRKPEEWELKGRDLYQGLEVFKGYNWNGRLRIFLEAANILSQIPCHLFGVMVNKNFYYKDKEQLKDDTLLYQLTFNQLLEQLDAFLKRHYNRGILLMDSRSTHRTSVQDGRLVKAYRDWVESREYESGFVDQPWFGVSKSSIGLQLADYVAYLFNLKSQATEGDPRKAQFMEAYNILQPKINLVEIPPPTENNL